MGLSLAKCQREEMLKQETQWTKLGCRLLVGRTETQRENVASAKRRSAASKNRDSKLLLTSQSGSAPLVGQCVGGVASLRGFCTCKISVLT